MVILLKGKGNIYRLVIFIDRLTTFMGSFSRFLFAVNVASQRGADRSGLRWGARGDHFPQSIKYVMVINSFFFFLSQYLLLRKSTVNIQQQTKFKIFRADENSDLLLFQFEIDSHICQNDTYYINVAGKLRVTLSPPGVKKSRCGQRLFQA